MFCAYTKKISRICECYTNISFKRAKTKRAVALQREGENYYKIIFCDFDIIIENDFNWHDALLKTLETLNLHESLHPALTIITTLICEKKIIHV